MENHLNHGKLLKSWKPLKSQKIYRNRGEIVEKSWRNHGTYMFGFKERLKSLRIHTIFKKTFKSYIKLLRHMKIIKKSQKSFGMYGKYLE